MNSVEQSEAIETLKLEVEKLYALISDLADKIQAMQPTK